MPGVLTSRIRRERRSGKILTSYQRAKRGFWACFGSWFLAFSSWKCSKRQEPTNQEPRANSYCSDFGSERFLGEAFASSPSRMAAAAGLPTFPSRKISFAVNFFPYTFSFAPLSGRRVDPSNEIPANSPREREYERISARIATSVAAVAALPLGPAAAEASAPSLTLLPISDSAPRGFITSRTKSVAWPPS